MNLTDLTVIYFAVGAPFAVYYFLQNRRENKSASFRLKNFFVFIFWLPYAVMLLSRNQSLRNFFKTNFIKDFLASDSSDEILQLQKRIENLLLESDLNISAFDYREIMERYAGLTLASDVQTNNNFESEIYRVAENENVKLGSVCLQRRNRNKLLRHQTEARRDFLQIIKKLSDSISDAKILQDSSTEFVKILKDDAAQGSLEKMFAEKLQTGKLLSVEYTEKDLWKPQEHKPLRSETISTRL